MAAYTCTALTDRSIIITPAIRSHSDVWSFTYHLVGLAPAEAKTKLSELKDRVEDAIRDDTTEIWKHLRYIVFQLERGEVNNNFHIQGYFRLARVVPKSWIPWLGIVDKTTEYPKFCVMARIPGGEEVSHLQAYCTKDNTRYPGTHPIEVIHRDIQM